MKPAAAAGWGPGSGEVNALRRLAFCRPRGLSRVNPRRVLLAACALLVAGAAHAADPFYTRLLREGTDAYNRKDYTGAVEKLRVACFGFLDEPEVLADGLTRLALAQAATGDVTGFAQTFERIAEVEDRFKGYSRATTPADLRVAFERLVLQYIPQATLAERPAFARLIPSPGDRFGKMTPAQKRKELEKLARAEPTVIRWPLMLADLSLAQGNPKAAVTAAEQALKIDPRNKEALRLRGIALADQRMWQPALDDLSASGAVGTDRAATEADLRSLVESARFPEASALYSKLPKDLAGDPAIRRLGGVAAVGVEQANGTPTRVPSPAATPTRPPQPTPMPSVVPVQTPLPSPRPTPAQMALTPAPPQTAPAAAMVPAVLVAARTPTSPERAELDAIQELVRNNKSDEAFVRARRLADEQKDLAEAQFLAGEIAYRTLHFPEAVAYFRRGGDPGDGRPLWLFYNAVCLYETGDRDGAAPLLKRSLPNIRHTAYVNGYVLKILGPDATPAARP